MDSEFGRTHFDDLVPSPTSEKAFLAQIHARKPGYLHNAAATGTLRSDMWVACPLPPFHLVLLHTAFYLQEGTSSLVRVCNIKEYS